MSTMSNIKDRCRLCYILLKDTFHYKSCIHHFYNIYTLRDLIPTTSPLQSTSSSCDSIHRHYTSSNPSLCKIRYRDLIVQYLCIQLPDDIENDQYSHIICYSCSDLLNKLYLTYQTFSSTQKLLRCKYRKTLQIVNQQLHYYEQKVSTKKLLSITTSTASRKRSYSTSELIVKSKQNEQRSRTQSVSLAKRNNFELKILSCKENLDSSSRESVIPNDSVITTVTTEAVTVSTATRSKRKGEPKHIQLNNNANNGTKSVQLIVKMPSTPLKATQTRMTTRNSLFQQATLTSSMIKHRTSPRKKNHSNSGDNDDSASKHKKKKFKKDSKKNFIVEPLEIKNVITQANELNTLTIKTNGEDSKSHINNYSCINLLKETMKTNVLSNEHNDIQKPITNMAHYYDRSITIPTAQSPSNLSILTNANTSISSSSSSSRLLNSFIDRATKGNQIERIVASLLPNTSTFDSESNTINDGQNNKGDNDTLLSNNQTSSIGIADNALSMSPTTSSNNPLSNPTRTRGRRKCDKIPILTVNTSSSKKSPSISVSTVPNNHLSPSSSLLLSSPSSVPVSPRDTPPPVLTSISPSVVSSTLKTTRKSPSPVLLNDDQDDSSVSSTASTSSSCSNTSVSTKKNISRKTSTNKQQNLTSSILTTPTSNGLTITAINQTGQKQIFMAKQLGNLKKYQCGLCEKVVTNIQIHVRRHTNDKPYPCTYCEKRFTNSGDLQIHTRIHTGEKPYNCPLCLKSYRTIGNFNSHVKTHDSGVRPHRCDLCNSTFNIPKDWYSHLRSSHRSLIPSNSSISSISTTTTTVTTTNARNLIKNSSSNTAAITTTVTQPLFSKSSLVQQQTEIFVPNKVKLEPIDKCDDELDIMSDKDEEQEEMDDEETDDLEDENQRDDEEPLNFSIKTDHNDILLTCNSNTNNRQKGTKRTLSKLEPNKKLRKPSSHYDVIDDQSTKNLLTAPLVHS